MGDMHLLRHNYWGDGPVSSSIWLGFFWLLMGNTGWIDRYAFDSVYDEWNDWTKIAGNSAVYGMAGLFGPLFIIWLLAYIKTESRIYQKVYYYAITWINVGAWINLLWVNIAYMIGGFTDGGKIWNLIIAITYDVAFFIW